MPLYDALQGLYCVYETIGSGGFGKVKKGVHVLTGETVAIKIMNKRKLGVEVLRVQTEIEAMKQLTHQNICQLYQVIETEEDFFLILEYCPNGELFDYIVSRDHLNEPQARFFFCQIVCAVAYMHHSGYAHRDLKPENLLLDDKGNLKLIDFGLCVKPAGGMDSHVSTCCGSPAYAAPELIAGKLYLGREADIWSLGVLLYALLCGFLPFDASNTALLYRKIQLGRYSVPPWLSSGSCDLINRMLQTDPNVRIKMDDLIRHPWVTNGSTIPLNWRSIIKSDHLDEECVRVLRRYYRKSLEEMRQIIQRSHPNYLNATYKLLVKKLRGKQPLDGGFWNYVVSINVSDEEIDKDELDDLKIETPCQRPERPSPGRGRNENKENKKSSKISKNETYLVQRSSLPPREVKLESAVTKGFVGSCGGSRQSSPVREDIPFKVYDEIAESSKQKFKDQIDKRVKWNIPKMPQANCMRVCGVDADDDYDGLRRLKCCSNARGGREDDEFIFTDFRKRKVGPELVDEKERKITKTILPATEAIYDNIVNLGLSPRTSDLLRKSRRKEVIDDEENNRQSQNSPGKKLTRWKNNQRRKAPEMRFLSPDCRKSKRYPDDSNQSNTNSSKQDSSKHDKVDCMLPTSAVKPCRRVIDWINASSTATSTDDDDIKSLARRKLEFDSDTPESSSNKDHLKSLDGSKEAKNEDSDNSESLMRKSIKTATKSDSESYRNTIDCGKVLQNSSKEHSSVTNSQNSTWKSMESNLNADSIAHRQSAYVTSASVETELDRICHTTHGNRNSKKTTMMENFEKGMDRLIGIFTPKKKVNYQSEPRKIKTAHNVNPSNQQEANLIMQKLKDALDEKRVYYREKGFSLKCSVVDRCNQTILSFVLEVVQINKASLGIYRKRLTGDVWYYKRLCEAVLKVAKV